MDEVDGRGLKYEDIVRRTADQTITLIDVREHKEVDETGKLPGSTHIPLGELKYSLERLTDEEFHAKHNLVKPSLATTLVFSCRSGGRARSAMETAISLGYVNAKFYEGGFWDWEKQTKAKTQS